MRNLSVLLFVVYLCSSAAVFDWRVLAEKPANPSRSPTTFQTIILLELSDYLLSSYPDDLSNDFVFELNVASGLIDAFIQGAKPNDKIWIVGYSGPESSRPSILGPFKTSSSELRSLRTLFTITEDESRLECPKKIKDLVAAGFYPKPGANADGYQALNIAKDILTGSPTFDTSVNQVSFITSGLINCERTTKSITHCEPVLNHRAYDANQLAYRELVETIAPEFVKLHIRIDTYLVGERTLPHSLLFPSPSKEINRCMTIDEINSSNYPDVLLKRFRIPMKDPNEVDFGQAIVENRKDSFFLAPNIHLSYLSHLTSGRFHPVRKRCPDVRYSGYRDLSHDTEWGGIDDICAWHQKFSTYKDQPLSLPAGQSTIGFRYLIHSEELVESGATDNDGRLVCEPRKISTSTWVRNEFFNYLAELRN